MRSRQSPPDGVLTRADLLAAGYGAKQITRAVAEGSLTRLRRDRYSFTPAHGVDRAVRVGGRLACVSVLQRLGVFVLDTESLHVHLERSASRLRAPDDRKRRLERTSRRGIHLHWWPLRGGDASLGVVGLVDALAQAIRCQTPHVAVATVDSILQLGIMRRSEIEQVFTMLPSRYRAILALVDGVAESGPETLMRLILRQLGLRFEAQVYLKGVGRVDFVVEGWLVIECDSKRHHEGWAKQKRDRKRDMAAAALGYATFRPLAEDIMYDRDAVLTAVKGLVRRIRPRS